MRFDSITVSLTLYNPYQFMMLVVILLSIITFSTQDDLLVLYCSINPHRV